MARLTHIGGIGGPTQAPKGQAIASQVVHQAFMVSLPLQCSRMLSG